LSYIHTFKLDACGIHTGLERLDGGGEVCAVLSPCTVVYFILYLVISLWFYLYNICLRFDPVVTGGIEFEGEF